MIKIKLNEEMLNFITKDDLIELICENLVHIVTIDIYADNVERKQYKILFTKSAKDYTVEEMNILLEKNLAFEY